MEAKATLVTGVIGDDVHVTGIRVLEHALRKAGFTVVALGVQVSQQQFIEAAIESKADALLVSSLGGHARPACEGLKQKCDEAGLKDIRLYIGGMLMSGGSSWEETEKTFKEMGFDRAYPPFTMPAPILADLETDFTKKRG